MSAVTNPVAQWPESPSAGVAVALARMVWAYDVPTTTWTLTADRRLEAGRLADLTGTNVFTLTPLASVGTAATLATTRRADGTVLIYRVVGDLVLSYTPGDSLATVAHTRASVASYTASVPDLVLSYAPGDALGTHTRSTTATYVAEV